MSELICDSGFSYFVRIGIYLQQIEEKKRLIQRKGSPRLWLTREHAHITQCGALFYFQFYVPGDTSSPHLTLQLHSHSRSGGTRGHLSNVSCAGVWGTRSSLTPCWLVSNPGAYWASVWVRSTRDVIVNKAVRRRRKEFDLNIIGTCTEKEASNLVFPQGLCTPQFAFILVPKGRLDEDWKELKTFRPPMCEEKRDPRWSRSTFTTAQCNRCRQHIQPSKKRDMSFGRPAQSKTFYRFSFWAPTEKWEFDDSSEAVYMAPLK